MNFEQDLPLLGRDAIFTPQECENIKRIAEGWPKTPAKVYESSDVIPTTSDSRQGTVALLSSMDPGEKATKWFGSTYHLQVIKTLGKYLERFPVKVDINSVVYQYTIYSNKNDRFTLHSDSGVNSKEYRVHSTTNIKRKMSMSIELDDPGSYTGCKIYFQKHDEKLIRFDSNQGSCYVFPSYIKHEVSPLTSGVRRSMVVWFNGPWWV